MQRPRWLPEVRDFIGMIIISAMVGMLFILLLRPVTVPDNQMTNILIGGFMTATTAVIQFYFGSSKGSVAKDDTINAIATGQATTAAVVEPVTGSTPSPAATTTTTATATKTTGGPSSVLPMAPKA